MNRIALDLGFIQIYWYSIMIALALLVGSVVMVLECRRQKMDEEKFVNILFWGVIFAIIGARLYYVIFNFGAFKDNLLDIVKIWEGGLAIHGGLIGGLITIILYCKKYKVRLIKITDMK